MQIVIDIPKEKYDMVRNKTYCGIYDAVIYKAIANGIPLPEGHGDLKDMDNFSCVFDFTREDFIYSGKDIERAIKSMTTIVPAATGSEE